MTGALKWISERPGENSNLPAATVGGRGAHRKSHTKSRHGCKSCKAKRIKCDEAKPTCTQCAHRQLDCIYTSTGPPIQQKPSISPIKHEIQQPQDDIRTKVMQFMHANDIPCDARRNPKYERIHAPEIIDHWLGAENICYWTPEARNRVLQLSFDAPYLLHGILAFSASHLVHFEPGNTKYEIASTIHYHNALIMYMNEISQGIRDDQAEQLLRTTFLLNALAFWAVSHPQTESLTQEEEDYLARERIGLDMKLDKSPNNLTWLQVWQGSRTILHHPAVQRLKSQGLLAKIFLELEPLQKGIDPFGHAKTDWYLGGEFFGLIALVDEDKTITQPESCKIPLLHLARLYESEPEDFTVGEMDNWIKALPPDFIHRLERRDHKALLILACWCGLYSQTDIWWILESAKKLCFDLCSELSQSDDIYIRSLLEFPSSVF